MTDEANFANVVEKLEKKRGRPPKAQSDLGNTSVSVSAENAPKTPAPVLAEEPLFPISLLRNYRPLGRFKVFDMDAGWRDPKFDEPMKMRPNSRIMVPKSEAKSVINRGAAERADEI